MKTTSWGMVVAVLSWSGGAAAAVDPFSSCTDASNYGYNTVANLVSASYNRARCDRALAAEYESFLTAIVPTYLSNLAARTTEAHGVCVLQGSYEAWLDTTQDEYADCQGVAGFGGIPRSLLGLISGSLLQSFYWLAPSSYSKASVQDAFAYPYATLDLTGLAAQCEAEARGALLGVPQELVTALIATVCL